MSLNPVIEAKISDSGDQLADSLMTRFNFSSRRELTNNALTLLQWIGAQYVEEGRKVVSINPQETHYVDMPMDLLAGKQKDPLTKLWKLEVGRDKFAAVDHLTDQFNFLNHGDLLVSAFKVLDWAATQIEAGRTVASLKEDSGRYRELAMPAFLQLKQRPS
jgi:hypothetical protein